MSSKVKVTQLATTHHQATGYIWLLLVNWDLQGWNQPWRFKMWVSSQPTWQRRLSVRHKLHPIPCIQRVRKVLRPLDFSHILLQPYSKCVKIYILSAIYTQYPIMTKRTQVFRNVCKRVKNSDPLLGDSKLNSGASSFHWSSLRCFYNLIGVHLW
jgi:hypothetical protein